LGGEELKIPLLALLMFGAGLFIQTPSFSAQEIDVQEVEQVLSVSEEQIPLVSGNPLRTAEQEMIIEGNTTVAVPAAGPSLWSAIRMILVLALAAAAIYGVVFFLKRSSKPAAVSDPFLKILATSHLGSNRYAHIVAVGEKAWLLGSSDGGVNLIGEIDDKDVINAMLLEDSSKKAAETQTGRFPDFISMLRRFGVKAESHIPGTADIRKYRERLKGL
jgi:flagellar protein FliO/FliZ